MKKLVKLTESDVKNIVIASVNKIINENFSSGTFDENESLVDSDRFSMIANKFKRYAEEIELFLEEYNNFFDELVNAVQKLGLVYINQDYDDDNFEERGAYYKYIFTDGTDSRDVYDDEEAYHKHVQKMETLASQLENLLPINYLKACRATIEAEEEICVEISFNLWY